MYEKLSITRHASVETGSVAKGPPRRAAAGHCTVNMNRYIMILTVLFASQAIAINILGIFPYQGKSHFFQFKIYLRELANRGHNVTVISYFPDKNPPPNYKDIHIADIEILEDNVEVQKSYLTILNTGVFLAKHGIENCRALVASSEVQDLVKRKPMFDIVVVEQFNSDCALGIAYMLGAPVVGMTSHVLMPYHYKRFGIPNNPAFVPFHFLEGGTKPTLYQRVERVILDIFFNTVFTYQQWCDQNTLAEYYDNIPPLEELARGIEFLLLYQHHVLTGSRLLPANVIEVGGYHVSKAKPLTGRLKKFVDEAKHGVIYISFGSMIKSTSLSDSKKQAILDGINQFPQRFIWKWEDETMEIDKNKLYISNWLPQIDILGHPKTLAFMSHAGMGGTTESMHYGVPMVAVPIFGDQPSNAAAIEESGFGVLLDFNNLNKETLVKAFKKVLNPEFRAKAKEVSKTWHERPMSPMDSAIYWTEYAAKHANFTFRTAAADTPLYQYLNLDVAAVLIAITATNLYILIIVIKKILYRSKKKAPSKKRQ